MKKFPLKPSELRWLSRIDESLIRASALLLVVVLSAGLSGCGTTMREFFGLDQAEAEASVEDLGDYHDPLVLINRADTLFDKRNYAEAAMTYERFLELHGVHRQTDYVQFRLGLSYLEQYRSVDRDSGPTTRAFKTFQRFLQRYPESLYVDEAQRHLVTSRRYLAEHELNVGRFYYRKKAYPAAIKRLEGVIEQYGDLVVAEQALYLLGRAYESTGKVDDAREILEKLLQSYPDSAFSERAKSRLARINGHDA